MGQSVTVIGVLSEHTHTFNMSTGDFYLRYYVGHRGKFGHEFLEFEFRPDGNIYKLLSIFFLYTMFN